MPNNIFEIPESDSQLDVKIFRNVYNPQDAESLKNLLIEKIAWQQTYVNFGQGDKAVPRLVSLYGESQYSYSGVKLTPNPWEKSLIQLKEKTEELAEVSFNGLLLNYYRDGRDSIGMHCDNEVGLGRTPTIGSLTFGDTRPFIMKHNTTKERISIELNSGDLLIMHGNSQSDWKHGITKANNVGPRVNLTFRHFYPQ
jgi:alkylated DNA repair dioxygenase AlkB